MGYEKFWQKQQVRKIENKAVGKHKILINRGIEAAHAIHYKSCFVVKTTVFKYLIAGHQE